VAGDRPLGKWLAQASRNFFYQKKRAIKSKCNEKSARLEISNQKKSRPR